MHSIFLKQNLKKIKNSSSTRYLNEIDDHFLCLSYGCCAGYLSRMVCIIAKGLWRIWRTWTSTEWLNKIEKKTYVLDGESPEATCSIWSSRTFKTLNAILLEAIVCYAWEALRTCWTTCTRQTLTTSLWCAILWDSICSGKTWGPDETWYSRRAYVWKT